MKIAIFTYGVFSAMQFHGDWARFCAAFFMNLFWDLFNIAIGRENRNSSADISNGMSPF